MSLETVGAGVAVVVLLVYVGGPILVRVVQKQPAYPKFEPISPEAFTSLPQAFGDFFTGATAQLTKAGFTSVAHLMHGGAGLGANVVLILFHNRATQDAAMAAVVTAPGTAGTKIQTAYVEFDTEFTDEWALNTQNSTEIAAYPDTAHKRVIRVPQVRDAARLFRVHTAALLRWGHGARRPLPGPDDVLEDFRTGLRRELDAQVETGYFYLDRRTETFRPTWKGAFLMSWRLLWPVVWVLRGWRNWCAARLLAELQE